MNIALNLLKNTSKTSLFALKVKQKSFGNLFLLRNVYCFYTKINSNHNKNVNKLLKYPKMLSLVCYLSSQPMDVLLYERIADQTLDHLNDDLEQILEQSSGLNDSDISLSSGVITMNLGKHGIYVINKQSPNRQIWLSSPISGPKRYDYMNNDWIYKHDSISLYDLLSLELSLILKREIKIKSISHYIS